MKVLNTPTFINQIHRINLMSLYQRSMFFTCNYTDVVYNLEKKRINSFNRSTLRHSCIRTVVTYISLYLSICSCMHIYIQIIPSRKTRLRFASRTNVHAHTYVQSLSMVEISLVTVFLRRLA